MMHGGIAQALLGGLVGVVLHLGVVGTYRLLRRHWQILLVLWAALYVLDACSTPSDGDVPSLSAFDGVRRGLECL